MKTDVLKNTQALQQNLCIIKREFVEDLMKWQKRNMIGSGMGQEWVRNGSGMGQE